MQRTTPEPTWEYTGPPTTLTLLRTLTALLEDPHPGLATWQQARNAAAIELHAELTHGIAPRNRTDWYENLWRKHKAVSGYSLTALKADIWEHIAASERILENLEIHIANIEPCPHPTCLLQSHLTTFLKQDGRGKDLE